MRHRVHKKSFNRDTKARRSLLLGVTTAVLLHGEVMTTRAKAKQAARIVDKAISRAKKGDLNARRQLHRIFGRRDVVNNLCDRVAPVFVNRQSGFTRLSLVGNRRGDNTPMYRLALVEALPVITKEEQKARHSTVKKTVASHSQDAKARDAIKMDRRTDVSASKKTSNLGVQKRGKANAVNGGRGK